MPVEIGKMVIKALVVESSNDKLKTKGKARKQGLLLDEKMKQQIIEESVYQVMAILERKKTR